jgi:predicted SAM-dependent methyltransferase
MRQSGLKVNIGCGDYAYPELVNCDIVYGKGVNVVCNALSLPFKDDSAEEVYMIHLIEHFRLFDARKVLKEAARVLKKGGLLIVEFPDIEKSIKIYNEDGNLGGLLKSLYGTQHKDYELHQHYFGWCIDLMMKEIVDAGLRIHHKGNGSAHNRPERDTRVQAIK